MPLLLTCFVGVFKGACEVERMYGSAVFKSNKCIVGHFLTDLTLFLSFSDLTKHSCMLPMCSLYTFDSGAC